jgi:hypothetical protein
MDAGEPASHWCKGVVESVVPRPTFTIPPPPAPPRSKPRMLPAPAATKPVVTASSQYQQMYQQMYTGKPSVSAPPVAQPSAHARQVQEVSPAVCTPQPFSNTPFFVLLPQLRKCYHSRPHNRYVSLYFLTLADGL